MSNKPASAPKVEQLTVEQLVPGMEVARDIFCSNGKILISAGTMISQYTISKLQKWKITDVTVLTQIAANPLADPKIQQFVNSYNKSVSVIKQAFNNIRDTQEVPLEPFSARRTNSPPASPQPAISSIGSIIPRPTTTALFSTVSTWPS